MMILMKRGTLLPIYIPTHVELFILMKDLTEFSPNPQTRLIQRNLVVMELLSITMLVCCHRPLMKKEWIASAVKRS
jgi:hypothetical protein